MSDVKSKPKDWDPGFRALINQCVEEGSGRIFSGPTAEEEATVFTAGLSHMRDIVLRLGVVYGKAEHLPDDSEPVTLEWFLSVGFQSGGERCVQLRYGPDFETDHHCYLRWHVVNGMTLGGDLTRSPLPWRNEATRGKVRLLCRALGVPLEEAA